MGVLSWLGLADNPPQPTNISSPWSTGSLQTIAWSDIFGIEHSPVTRLEALKVPAVARGRSLLHSVFGNAPLKMFTRGDVLATNQPTWLYRSDTGISPRHRNLAILDDHIFSDAALLAVSRGADGAILDAVHVDRGRWNVNKDGRIEVDGTVARAEDVVWIPGPGPGLLLTAGETIRGARSMERAWAGRVRNPTPTILLEEKEAGSLTETEVRDYLDGVRSARQDPDGTVAFVPAEVSARLDNGGGMDLFDSGRNAVRIDVANHMALPASLLDGSMSTATLTYSTAEGKRNEFFDYSIPYWAGPIQEGLSLDNVTPRGSYIRFDFGDLITTPQDGITGSDED